MSLNFKRSRIGSVRRADPTERLPDEQSIEDEARLMFAEPDLWMSQEHPMLGGRTPRECIADGDEQPVWDLLRSIKYVGQT
jgi:hypothetical protein